MKRLDYIAKLQERIQSVPVVALLGPRQCGKTTLSRQFAEEWEATKKSVTRFDLEDPTDLAKLQNPKMALENLSGLIIIDEIQLSPNLFEVIRVLVDRPNLKASFLILGSASRDLIKQSSETLAGRISYIEVTPFSLFELPAEWQKLWIRGGFPRSFLAPTEKASQIWRQDFIQTFLERDIPQLGIRVPAPTLRRFWMMLAHYHGQILNVAELAKSLGISETAIRHYVDILAGTFMIRILQPWFQNVAKRQIKRPKIYFEDSGLLHALLGEMDEERIYAHPKVGASWEGFVVENLVRALGLRYEDCYFWGVHSQYELDLLILKNGKRIGFEIKFAEAPKIKKTHHDIVRDLNLDELIVVTPTVMHVQVAPKIKIMNLENCLFYFKD